MPYAPGGDELYRSAISDTEDLPPHRAAMPVYPTFLAAEAASRRRNLIVLGIVFSLALHGGFFVAAMLWGQGETLPDANRDGTVQVEISDGFGSTVAEKRVDASFLETQDGAPERASETQAAAELAEATVLILDQARREGADIEQRTAEHVPPEEPESAEAQPVPATVPLQASESAEAQPVPATVPLQESESAEPQRAEPAHAVEEAEAATPDSASLARHPEEPSSEALAAAQEKADLALTPNDAEDPPIEDTVAEISAYPPIPSKRLRESGPTASVEASGHGRPADASHGPASPGAVFGYKRRVRARVMQNLPRSRNSGRVIVGFQLSRSGGLLAAFILHSSGNPTVDRTALRCVRAAGPYPMPPRGATMAQLALSIDFRFQ